MRAAAGEELTTALRQACCNCIEPKHGGESSTTRGVAGFCWGSRGNRLLNALHGQLADPVPHVNNQCPERLALLCHAPFTLRVNAVQACHP